ncbi:MAG: amino acid transporter [Kiritimatiellia bacterium]|jgi:amino acid transporter
MNVEQKDHKFGTFGGVFTPCTLTILGVIFFLRFGQVIGQAGVLHAVIIVLSAKLITTLTTFSLSAIATNTQLKGGGAYYLISRSLGVEFGGSIGVVFFLAQAVSVAMYVIGFTEAFLAAFPGYGFSFLGVATCTNVLVFICVFIGAGWTIKVQYGILALLLLSILAVLAGAIPQMSFDVLRANMAPHYLGGATFFTMFALFFPAVTGIMAGANMSGDLRDPGKSIPRGTLSAIVFTGFIYLSMIFVLGAVRPAASLQADNLIMKSISISPVMVIIGIFAATLSSALGSMMGAPRILQAFARDRIILPLKPFAKTSGKANEPRRATILTFVIAQISVLCGDLNAIAPIITMFFMITYGTINIACFYEAITHNPSYRPRFRLTHWTLALLGAVGCLLVMFLLNPVWACIAMLGMAGLWWYISRIEVSKRWGDATRGFAFERCRRALLRLEQDRYHPKNWRPSILAFIGLAGSRSHLAEYGHWMTAGHGILSLAQVITGEVENRVERMKIEADRIREFIHDETIDAFPALVVASDVTEGMNSLIQCHGVGGISPNTVLIGWSDDALNYEAFCTTLRLCRSLDRSIICMRNRQDMPARWAPPTGPIDIWWRGQQHGPLMLLLAHLLVQNHEWRNRKIRLLRAVSSENDQVDARERLQQLAEESRIAVQAEVFVTKNVGKKIRSVSADSALVFLGFDPPIEGQEVAFMKRTNDFTGDLPNVVLVSSAGGISLHA